MMDREALSIIGRTRPCNVAARSKNEINLSFTYPPTHSAVWSLISAGDGLRGCWLDLPTAQRLAGAGVASIDMWMLSHPTSSRRMEKCLEPIYTVVGIIEWDEVAIVHLYYDQVLRSSLPPGSFTGYMRNFFKLTPYVRNRIRWALSRGSIGSYHNERLQDASIAPLNPRMKELLEQDEMPFEAQGKCACGGEARYDEKLALICDDCNTSYGYKIVTDNFMNMSGEEEDSGDDDSYQVTEMEGPDVDQVSELTYDSTNYEQVERLARNLRKELETKEREEVRQLPYIESNSRKMKSEFLDYRIRLLLKDGGIEQAAVKDMLWQMFGTIVTASAVKTAIRRMEQAGRVESTSICTPRGKRIFIRLIAKT